MSEGASEQPEQDARRKAAADALTEHNVENRAVTDLLAAFLELAASGDCDVTLPGDGQAIGFFLYRHQERMDERVEEASRVIYDATRKGRSDEKQQ